jgi:serine O-acetyltransferase
MEKNRLECLADGFLAALDAQLGTERRPAVVPPDRRAVETVCRKYLDLLFPVFYGANGSRGKSRERRKYLQDFETLLAEQIRRAIRFDNVCRRSPEPVDVQLRVDKVMEQLFEMLPELSRLMGSDIEAAFHNDPAAMTHEQIVLSYPCIEAITVQRLAHRLYNMDVPYIPRIMTENSHSHTGIDIHPGAILGESFFIDHGTGVVIGETATIGNLVTLYHGVTLGAFNPLVRDPQGELKRGHNNKRHPDLEDGVTVYPNATILGGGTRIGHHSVIGGNVWLTHSVAPYSRVTLKDPELRIYGKTFQTTALDAAAL